MSASSTNPNIFKIKHRYLNFQSDELDENYGDPYRYQNSRFTNGIKINPAISKMALKELNTTTHQSYGNRIAGFNQFSMKPLETRNNNDESVNKVFATGMNRSTLTTPTFYVQPLPSRYQILSPKPDDFDVSWSQPGNGNNNFDLV